MSTTEARKNELLKKRRFYNVQDYLLNNETKTLILTPKFHKYLLENKGSFGFGKITGTYLGEILETDSFKSPFAAFAKLCKIGMPMLDEKYVNAGKVLEGKILEKISKAKRWEIQRFDATEYQYDYFKDTSSLFGGLPDGYVEDEDLIIEIKTAGIKKINEWEDNLVPVSYGKQASLYTYLNFLKKHKKEPKDNELRFLISCLFLEEEDYIQPENVRLEDRRLKTKKIYVNLPQLKDDMQKCQDWYNHFTEKGESPIWKEARDKDLLDFLKCKNQNEYEALLNKWVSEGKFK
ncbi:hypothetical protein JN00_0560 [Metamycoplasma subdolum]|uniref:YqaJ-like recombinase protein n=1 Tax=Metamycoplasma subdolum TaxID=92407 RepID=A0A3L9ZYC7_9BACT|nr:hypothetical protein [Metamycoplasma subdolum]RMA77450.1 hypothetical protein JN00_0560 [Metamycoplasma subdolum]WPB50321.1 hypothetical protein R9C05_01795 [Metamycoplasma subdolum]